MSSNFGRITTNGKALFLAYDHGLEHGPEDFGYTGQAIDPGFVLQIAKKGGYNGVILQKGIVEKYFNRKKYPGLPLIVKLNGKTKLIGGDPVSSVICSVKEAKKLGAKAVGYTIYPGSKHESMMLAEFGQIVREAHRLGLPTIAWVYPRGKKIKNENSPKTIEYAARIGLELGADIVKIKWPGSKKAMERAVRAAGRAKVMLAGGPKTDEKGFLKMAREAMATGVMGMVVGRNIWQNKKPLEITEKIKKIVFK
jgi:class I fructose-bisphosphate aldolase